MTSLKNGQNRPFRVLHKSERAPVRALKASSSGRFHQYLNSCASSQELFLIVVMLIKCRYLLIMFRDAPVEVWAMTKTPLLVMSLDNLLFLKSKFIRDMSLFGSKLELHD